jgi:IclR family transcriptional regulator, KDG regulon repressor
VDKTLLKGLRILEILARSEGARGISDLAAETDLNKSNIHRVLKTLESAGYLKREAVTGRYGLSLKLWELGVGLLSRLDFKQEAQVQLSRLAADTRETVHLSVLSGSEVIYLDKIDSPEPVRAYSEVGGRAPAYAVATGKAMLAYQPEALIERVGEDLHAFTAKTITDVEALKRELAQVRAQGYAVNQGEWRETVYGLAAPIRTADGIVEAAIGISGPSMRLKPQVIKRRSEQVIAAANEISRKLGYTPR